MKAKVLIVDDEEDFLEALAERLRSRGIDVATAQDGVTALSLVSKEPFHAVFLDYYMPGINGLETLKLMLNQNPDLLVYILTGKAGLKEGVEAIKLGAKDVIEKPAELQEILEIIKNAENEYILNLEQKIKESISDILRTKGW
jgi:DNA-binding NtrC family response regulator